MPRLVIANIDYLVTVDPQRRIVRDGALSALAVVMTWFVFTEARKPHPWNARPEKSA